MNIDSGIKLIDTCTKLLGVVLWPGLILSLIIWFSSSLREFFANLSELSLKAAGVDLNMKRRQIEAAEVLGRLRRSMGDVHGSRPALQRMALTCIKLASAISDLLDGSG